MTGAGRRFPWDPATLRMAQEMVDRFMRDPALQRQMREGREALFNSPAMLEFARRNREAMMKAASPAFAQQWQAAVRSIQSTDPDIFSRLASSYAPTLDEAAVQEAVEDLRSADAATVEEAIEAVANDPETEAQAEEAVAALADSHVLDEALADDAGVDEDGRANDVARIALFLFVMFVGGGLIGAGLALPAFGAATNNVVGLLAYCGYLADKILLQDR